MSGHESLKSAAWGGGDPARQHVEDAVAEALAFAGRTGAVFIHPYDHPDIVAGQGTIGLEIIEQCPQVRTVVVPVGGGGLAAGITVAVKGLDPQIEVVGVQAEAVAPYPGSLAAGHPVSVRSSPTMADGIAVCRPGDIPFGILSGHAGRVVTVSEESLSRGLLLCLERAKQVVEPAGAAGVAALLEHPRDFAPPRCAPPVTPSPSAEPGPGLRSTSLASRCWLAE